MSLPLVAENSPETIRDTSAASGRTIRLGSTARSLSERAAARLARHLAIEPEIVQSKLYDAAWAWRHQTAASVSIAPKERKGSRACIARKSPDAVIGLGDAPGAVAPRRRKQVSLQERHPDDIGAELAQLERDAAAIRSQILDLSTEARDTLGIGTWRRGVADMVTAAAFDRLEVDLRLLQTAAAFGQIRVQDEQKPAKGRPGFTAADRELVKALGSIWWDLTGTEALAYYSDTRNPPRKISDGARVVGMAFRMVTGKQISESSLIALI